jgi:hypothetical protein
MREYSSEIAGAVMEFLESDSWKYDWDEDRGLLKLMLSSRSKFQSFTIYISIKTNGFSQMILYPLKATEDVRDKVAEFITRANYGLYIGGFEMDYDDGEVRFRSSLLSADTLPTTEQIKHILYVSINMAEKYANSLAMVLFDVASPKDAVERAEE